MTAWSGESENITITFDEGFVKAEEINKVIIHRSNKNNEVSYASLIEEDSIFTPSKDPMSGAYRDLYQRGFVGELKHFAYCIQNGKNPSSNGTDNIYTMMLCDKILNSIN